jgi:hypothetical protein
VYNEIKNKHEVFMSKAIGLAGLIKVPPKVLRGNGAPSATFVGELGQDYYDTSTDPNTHYKYDGSGWKIGGNADATNTVAGIVKIDTDGTFASASDDFVPTVLAAKTYTDSVAIAGAPDASTTQKGIIEIATDMQAVAVTETDLAIVPSNLAAVFAAPPAAGFGSGTPRPVASTTLSASGAFSLTGDTVDVAEGGTGASTLTDHGIVLGSGTGAVTVTAVGTNNQVLIGQSGADPIWTTNVDLPGTLDVTGVATFDSNVGITGTATVTGDIDIDNININGNSITSTDTNGDINLTPDGTGDVVISSVDINAGAIDGVTIGTNSVATQIAVDNLDLNGNTISSTDTNGDINLSPDGTGTVVINTDLDVDNININGNTIISTDTNGDITISPDGTGTVVIDTDLDVDNLNFDGNTIISTDVDGNINLTPNGSGVVAISEMTLTTDLAVAHGGTGASSLTDHSVLVGSGTAAVTALTVGTDGQVLVGSSGADPVFANIGSANSSISATEGAGTLSLDVDESYLQTASVTIATGDVLTLATTPVELVAAPGAGQYIEFLSAQLILDYNSIAYTEAGDNLGIKYTNASGVQVSSTIECTGFIDQSADTITNAVPAQDVIVAASAADNAALVLDNLGSNFAAGNSPLIVKVSYRVITSGL